MKKTYITKLEGKEWTDCLDLSFENKKKDIKIDGFRKGQAPKDVYIKKYGVESLYMDAIDIAVDILYGNLLKDPETITPVATPSIDIKDINKDRVEIEFTLISAPEIKIGKYKDLKVKKAKVEVTEEEIDHEIEHLKEQFAELKVLDKKTKIENGHTAVIDFEGFKAGVPFDGGKGEDYSLVIGSHTFIPGFEEQLVGLKAGDKKDVNVTFPENYHSEDLKGKEVTFKVNVKEVKERIYPEFNKEFFADLNVGGVESLDDLKDYIKKNKEAEKEKQVLDEYLFACLDEICKDSTYEIPEEMTEDETNRLVREFSSKLEMQGMKLDDYLKYCNSNIDDFKAQLKDEANKRIGYRLVLDEVVVKEKIDITDKELDEELKKAADLYKLKVEDFLKEVGSKDVFKYDLIMKRAMEVITGEKQK